jgi:AcrR family transcriptional regulator
LQSLERFAMPSTRERLIQSALTLFTTQGVSGTTTRKIAELADVNEVTLFRHFGNKQGLLLAVLEESAAFQHLGESLVQRAGVGDTVDQVLKAYASVCLHALEQVPELVRSVVGEAEQYPVETRRALGQGLTEANRSVAQYLAAVIEQGHLKTHLPAEKLASLLNGMLLGYAVIDLTSDGHELWVNREDFLDHLVQLFLHGAVSTTREGAVVSETASVANSITELPAALVHDILRQARQIGLQDYALAYVMFAAGVSTQDIVGLRRSHVVSNPHQHILHINSRQVTINQWIMGKRYGSYTANPLTKWLKSRKDEQPALFLNSEGQPLSEADLNDHWQVWLVGVFTEREYLPQSAQQTWCIDMLLRGISLENLSILTGLELVQLQPYAERAKTLAAIAQATRLDQKTTHLV